MLGGTCIALLGCVVFWNIRKQKYIRAYLLKKYSEETINRVAWASSLVAKGIGVGLYIKAAAGYIEERKKLN